MMTRQNKQFAFVALLVAALATAHMGLAQTATPKPEPGDATKKNIGPKIGGVSPMATPKATPTPTPKATPAPTPKATPIPAPIIPVQKPPMTPTPIKGGPKPPIVATPTPVATPRVGIIGEPTPKGGKKPVGVPEKDGGNVGKGKSVDGSKMTKDQFRSMPNSTVILLPGGKQTTKQQMMDALEARFKAQKSTPPKTASRTDARSTFMQKQQTEIKSRNGKVQTEMARLKTKDQAFQQSSQYQAINTEALQLQAQYQKASPAEKQKIEARARQLQKQLEDLRARNSK